VRGAGSRWGEARQIAKLSCSPPVNYRENTGVQ
jgi:hypothetical protein